MTIEERLEALTMNLELLSHELDAYTRVTNERLDKILMISERNAEQISGLIEVSRNHERRIGRLEA